jgi:hypothetical protein
VVGDTIELTDWRIDVVDASGHRAARALLHAPVAVDEESAEAER